MTTANTNERNEQDFTPEERAVVEQYEAELRAMDEGTIPYDYMKYLTADYYVFAAYNPKAAHEEYLDYLAVERERLGLDDLT